MKIVYMLDLFPVFSETFIVNEIHELRRKGFKISIFSRVNTLNKSHGRVVHTDAKLLLKDIHYFPTLRRGKILFFIFISSIYLLICHPIRLFKTLYFSTINDKIISSRTLYAIYYAVCFERNRVEHIHAHFALNACKQAMLISMLSGIEYSFTIHAHDIFLENRSDLMVEKFQYAKFVVSISEFNKNYISYKYPAIDTDKIKIIHCGINLSIIQPQNKERTTDELIILSIGRLVGQKGYKYLIAACHILKNRYRLNFVCNIAGEGEDRAELEKLISSYGLSENVILAGAKRHDEVIDYCEKSNLFVLPCVKDKMGTMDGIPVALMEAMAMQLPVISTKISGIPELIKDGSGMLVDPGDIEGLALAINEFCRLPSGKKNEIGKNARSIIEKLFNLNTETEKLASLMIN